MTRHAALRRIIAAALVYSACAALAIVFTRVNGGFAMYWLATAAIVPIVLSEAPDRRPWLCLACAIGSAVVTGLIGLGWRAAGPIAVANMVEAAIAVTAVDWANRRFRTFTAMPWMATTYLAGGLIGPIVSGLIAAPVLHFTVGRPWLVALGEWTASHGMGFIAVFPCAGLIARARARRAPLLVTRAERWRAAGALTVVVATAVLVFGQSQLPLLFIPLMVLMYAMLLCDLAVTAVGVLLLLAIATYFTLTGHGPMAFMNPNRAAQFYILQGYFACIALTVAPIAVMLERRRRLFARLAESEARYRALADFSTDIIMVSNRDGTIRFVSPSIGQIGSYKPDALIGKSANTLIAPQYRKTVQRAHLDVLADTAHTATIEFLGVTAGRHLRWFESHLRAIVLDDGTVDGVCSVIRDIGHRKRREDELRAVALTDPLTSLANRRAFEMFVGQSAQDGHLAMIDLDHFKRINDTFGHECGDRVLKAFARAARSVLREDDVVARIGGEEFAVYLPGSTLAQARIVIGRIAEALAQQAAPHLPKDWRVTASIGMSAFDGALGGVLKRADAALYQAKTDGRDRLAIAA